MTQETIANTPKLSAFKHSPFGIISLTIALLDTLYFILAGPLYKYIDENNVLHKFFELPDSSSLFLIIWCFVAFLGIVLCMIGVKKDQKKVFSLFGLLLGAPIFWFLFVIVLLETNLMPKWLG
jgi:hypothetical protein